MVAKMYELFQWDDGGLTVSGWGLVLLVGLVLAIGARGVGKWPWD